MNTGPALRLELRASRALAIALVAVHGVGAGCVLAVAPGYPGMAIAALLLSLGAVLAWNRALLRGRNSVRRLELSADGAASIELAGGRHISCRVGGRRHVSAWWVALPLRGAPSRSLLVVADMLAPDEFRYLRLWALWGRVPAMASAQRLARSSCA